MLCCMAGAASKKSKRPSLEPLFLLDDEPIGGQETDLFPTDTFARVIARAALGTKGPFTIGVYGGWGSGKTSTLRAAKSMIDDDPTWAHVVTVNFNAWQYEREQHPTIPLVAAIENAIRTKLEDNAKLSTKAFAFANKSLRFVGGVLGAFLAATSANAEGKAKVPFVAEGGVGVEFDGNEFVERLDEAAKGGEPPEPSQWEKFRDATLYLSIFDRLQALHTAAENMGGDDLRKFPRVVVFLDDLDRCQAEKAFELLESVKLVLSQPGFVFVLALNHDVVSAYLDHLAEKRYGEKRSRVHDSYLDKIVQLPLVMPPRRAAFESFASELIGCRLDSAASSDLREGLKRMARVLAVASGATPRTLVRRVNRLLIDVELREEAELTDALKTERPPYERFAGLCLIQRTLEDALGLQRTRELAEADDLCQHLAAGDIFGAMSAVDDALKPQTVLTEAVKERKDFIAGKDGKPPLPAITHERAKRFKELLDFIYQNKTFLYAEETLRDGTKIEGTSVLTCKEGRDWLASLYDRLAVMKYAAQRPAENSASTDGDKPVRRPIEIGPELSSPLESIAHKLELHGFPPPFVRHTVAMLEQLVRRKLRLPFSTPIRVDDCRAVRSLELDPLASTNVTMFLLSDRDSPFTELQELNVTGSNVTDYGVAALIRNDSALTSLTTLSLAATSITDEGLKSLALQDSPLKNLKRLVLRGTGVTDAGIAALRNRFPDIQIER